MAKDGERRIALTKCKLYHPRTGWKEYEPAWREVYFFEGEWREWCGKYGVVSTNKPDIIRFGEINDKSSKDNQT